MTATDFPEPRGGREFAAEPRPGRLVPALLAIASAIVFASRKIGQMTTAVEDLTAAVEAEGTIVKSAVTLITGLLDQVQTNKSDPDALEAIVAKVREQTATLAAAIPANTDAAPPPPPAPTVVDAGEPAAIGGDQAATTGPTAAASATDPLTAQPTAAS